jgi:RNA polymerase sigma factor, sigma-70 family
MNNQDLAKIVKQVKTNKEKYFEILFNEIYRTVYYLSFKFLNNETEAQDASQDIIVYIYHHIEELKVPEGFNRWMNQIIYSKCKNHVRTVSNRREENYEEIFKRNEEQTSLETPEKIVQTKEKNQFVLELINNLPMKQQEVVLLYYYQQLTTPEIADVLSCSLPSIQNRLHKAKRAIKNKVEKTTAYSVQQLFGIGFMPVLGKILAKEVYQIGVTDMQGKMWKSFHINKSNTDFPLNPKKQKVNAYEYKTDALLLCLGLVAGMLLLTVFISATKEWQSGVQSQIQKLSVRNELQPEEVIYHGIEVNTIHNKMSNNKEMETLVITEAKSWFEETMSSIQVQTEEENQNQKFSIFDISTDNQIAVWQQSVEEKFVNTAFIIDKDLEDLKYTSEVSERIEGESMYQEEEYKKDSEIVYHTAITPTVSFRKSSSVTEEIITYYMHLENIGEVVAYNIVVKDVIPEYTEYIQILYEQSDFHIQIEAEYKENMDTIFWVIEELGPTEAVTLAFQVKVEGGACQNNHEIRNIAYMKVSMGSSEADNRLIEEQDYIKSNEIIYIMRQKEVNIPRTNDITRHGEIYILFLILSFILIIIIQKRISRVNTRK